MVNCERQTLELVQRARGPEGGILVCRSKSIEVHPGVARGVGSRKRHARNENGARVEFPGGHQCSLNLKMGQLNRYEMDQ